VIDSPLSINRATGQITLGSPGGLYLDSPVPPGGAAGRGIIGTVNGSIRWQVQYGNGDTEGANNAVSNFGSYSYDNNGTYIGNPLLIARGTGQVTFAYQANFNAPIIANNSITTKSIITIDAPSGADRYIVGRTQTGLNLWLLDLGNSTAITGGNVGADFGIYRYADGTGAYLGTSFSINRSSGNASFEAAVSVNGYSYLYQGANIYNNLNIMPTSGNGIVQFYHSNQSTQRGYVGWLNNDTGVYLVNSYSGNYYQARNDGWNICSGSFNITGNESINGSSTIAGNLQVNNNATVSGTMLASYGTINGGFTTHGNIQCDNNINCNTVTANGLTSYGALQVNGNGQCNGQMYANPINSAGNNFAHAGFYCDNSGGGFFQRDASGNMYCQLYCGGDNNAYFVNNRSGYNLQIVSNGYFYANIAAGGCFKAGGGAWYALSDRRIKNVLDDYRGGLREILQLNPIVYTFKGNDRYGERQERVWNDDILLPESPGNRSPHFEVAKAKKEFVGFDAREIMKIFPRSCLTLEGFLDDKRVDDIASYDLSGIIYALVNAVKELNTEIMHLQARQR
jgi:hypothetical protein